MVKTKRYIKVYKDRVAKFTKVAEHMYSIQPLNHPKFNVYKPDYAEIIKDDFHVDMFEFDDEKLNDLLEKFFEKYFPLNYYLNVDTIYIYDPDDYKSIAYSINVKVFFDQYLEDEGYRKYVNTLLYKKIEEYSCIYL